MKTKTVVVVPYDSQWPSNFEAIRQEIAQALDSLALRIEHVGSTSVPGLSAKPIIDIDVVIQDYNTFPEVVKVLAQIGYEHKGDLGIRGREAFRYEGKNHLQKHHLYVCPSDSPELHRHITFRNYLRTHPDAVQYYSAVKQEAARRYPDDIDAYIRHKSPCIEALYRQCGLME